MKGAALVLLFFLLLLADVGGGDHPGTVIVDPLLAGAVDNRDEPLGIIDGVCLPSPTTSSPCRPPPMPLAVKFRPRGYALAVRLGAQDGEED